MVLVVQLVEGLLVMEEVAGSSPVRHPDSDFGRESKIYRNSDKRLLSYSAISE